MQNAFEELKHMESLFGSISTLILWVKKYYSQFENVNIKYVKPDQKAMTIER